MPKSKTNWADLIERGLKNLNGEATVKELWSELNSIPEAKEKIDGSKSRVDRKVDVRAQIRAILTRDSRFEKGTGRGVWKLKTSDGGSTPSSSSSFNSFSLPARYIERATRILKLMQDFSMQTEVGWAQRRISRELSIDINAVSKIIKMMIFEGILFLKAGTGKTYNPYVYAPCKGVLEQFRQDPKACFKTTNRKIALKNEA